MARRQTSRTITDICGGRAAIVPADVADNGNLSNGACRLFTVLCGRANRRDECELVVKAYAARYGVTPRAVQKWKSELEAAGLVVQLHEGDKAKGLYRVVRSPEDRPAAIVENLQRLVKRRRAKTTRRSQLGRPANHSSHPRCEPRFAQENIDKITLNPPGPIGPTPLIHSNSHHGGAGRPSNQLARRGIRAGGPTKRHGHLIQSPHVQQGEKAEQAECIDWRSWANWLARTHIGDNPIGYMAVQGERIGKAFGLAGDAADKILDAALRTSRSTGQHPDRVIDCVIAQRENAP